MKILKAAVCLFLFLCGCCGLLQAQHANFLTKGRIEFEKTTNVLAITKELLNSQEGMSSFRDQLLDNFQKNYKPFQVMNYDFLFDGNKTYFAPGAESPLTQTMPEWLRFPAQDNIVYTDLQKHETVSLKNIFDTKYLISDSTRNIKWKITDETRDIAGFQCRRANAIIMDSIYAVAFYTTQIVVSGGPESVNGLPGMILGLALPHEHITWFAKKVYTDVDVSKIAPPSGKSKQMNMPAFRDALQSSMKNWGTTGNFFMRTCLF